MKNLLCYIQIIHKISHRFW